jgi:hypothetical protein
MCLDKKLFFIFFSTSIYCFSSSPPSASQALQFFVDLGFQNSRAAFQRVCVHRIPVFILNYIYARVVILGILRVVNWSLLFCKKHFKEIK